MAVAEAVEFTLVALCVWVGKVVVETELAQAQLIRQLQRPILEAVGVDLGIMLLPIMALTGLRG